MKTRALLAGAVCALGLFMVVWLGCGKDSVIDVHHDAQGNEQIHVDNQKLKENLRQTGREIQTDARRLGNAVQQEASDADRKYGPAARETVADAALTTRVKARLIAAPDLGGIRIHVNSRDGEVTLSGTVASAENRRQAEQLARDTDGVHAVDNRLEVGPVG
jgi:hyperosmotically inducible protein